jgi:hypothetical protein
MTAPEADLTGWSAAPFTGSSGASLCQALRESVVG